MNIRGKKYRLVGFVSIIIVLIFFRNHAFDSPSVSGVNKLKPYKRSGETCFESKRIAFVKVHKAASTTITTILQRFGYTRNLTFALPRTNFVHIGFFETFNPKNVLPIRKGSVYEIVCQHVVFNKQAFKRYLPPDINIIASVREPSERFVSTFMFFYPYSLSVKTLSTIQNHDTISLIREYLTDPQFYEPEQFKAGSLVLNRMSFDLGLPKEQYANDAFVEEYIQMLDHSMAFVLVADMFDESLVILKRRMCWSTKDILYKVQHKSHHKKPELPPDLKETIRKLSPSDYQIYQYFSSKLSNIALVEARLEEEVTVFRRTLMNVSSFCDNLSSGKKQDAIFLVRSTLFSEGFTFDKSDCELLSLTEQKFVSKLIRSQVPKDKQREFMGWE